MGLVRRYNKADEIVGFVLISSWPEVKVQIRGVRRLWPELNGPFALVVSFVQFKMKEDIINRSAK
ncbi:hypothetical protein A3715_12900 [Oleiphilus sp. HI0009]|nr:hypothetical protein A3715_12900 [Oleiphilus sp. HI0009]KZY69951.1 hypothetical protein A3738_15620 [Oleiphilus sp. HI0066]KZY71966.1 hypothetical protein A3739_03600 [Oleiphilus sp. HI0067]